MLDNDGGNAALKRQLKQLRPPNVQKGKQAQTRSTLMQRVRRRVPKTAGSTGDEPVAAVQSSQLVAYSEPRPPGFTEREWSMQQDWEIGSTRSLGKRQEDHAPTSNSAKARMLMQRELVPATAPRRHGTAPPPPSMRQRLQRKLGVGDSAFDPAPRTPVPKNAGAEGGAVIRGAEQRETNSAETPATAKFRLPGGAAESPPRVPSSARSPYSPRYY
jgi:hypothetical protein